MPGEGSEPSISAYPRCEENLAGMPEYAASIETL